MDRKLANYELKTIKGAIQMYLARECTASETILISSLNAQVEMMSMQSRTTPRSCFNNSRQHTPMQQSAHTLHYGPLKTTPKIDPSRWQRGPISWTPGNNKRLLSMTSPLAIPPSSVGGVKANLIQCFYCGQFGHTYNKGTCESYNGNGDRAAAHWKDWRKVSNNKLYSLNALFPQKYSLPINQSQHTFKPRVNAVEVDNEPTQRPVEVSALDWSSDGFGLMEEDSDIPTKYLFDGGATDAVSNDRSLFINYHPLPHPIPIKTAADDSHAVIVGRGQLAVDDENGIQTIIDNVYYCLKATTTIISPGALIAGGAKLSLSGDNDYVIRMKDGQRIHAVHQNQCWFIRARVPRKVFSASAKPLGVNLLPNECSASLCKLSDTSRTICAMKSSYAVSKLWHARLVHVSMKHIKKLFKSSEAYGLPNVKHCDVKCNDCYTCKSTRDRILGSTGREPKVLEMVVTDVAGPFTPCISGEQLMVTFRDVASTYSEICIIKHKSEVHQRLVNVVNKWERSAGVKIKAIRSDRGGEYISGALDKSTEVLELRIHDCSLPT